MTLVILLNILLVQFHLLDNVAATIEEEAFYLHVVDTLQEELVLVPVEGFVVGILHHLVVAIQQTVNALGIENGCIESLEHVVLNADGCLLASVEEFLLPVQVGNLGIDGDNGIGKLELTGQRIDETVLANGNIATCTCLEPTVAVTAKQDGATGGVVK